MHKVKGDLQGWRFQPSEVSPQLQQQINQAEAIQSDLCSCVESYVDQTYVEVMLGNTEVVWPGENKILGVCWDSGKDQLIFHLDSIADLRAHKEECGSTVGSPWAPVVIKSKVFFPTLCDRKVSWDEPLRETMIQQWQDLVRGL